MLGNDHSPMLRRAEAASSALEKAAANPGDPFEMIRARREAETVVAELAKVTNDERALALVKAAQSQPRPLYDERPGAAPSLTQSSNISSSPRGTRVPVTPSGGSTVAPHDFPQSANYGRPSGDIFAEMARAKADAEAKTRPYTGDERRAMALSGEALPDGSHPIKNRADLVNSIVTWADAAKPEGALKEHIQTRAHAIGAENLLPSDFRGADKISLAARLRKN